MEKRTEIENRDRNRDKMSTLKNDPSVWTYFGKNMQYDMN